MNLFQSILIALVEGLTEFLPISSTGHMILASTAMGIHEDEFVKTFVVFIQLGAILAGEYNYYTNEITIYLRNNRNIKTLVDTQIHEMIHHVFIDTRSKQVLYQRQLEDYGYWDHPGEILSFTLSKTLTERYMRSRFDKKWVWF